MNDHAMTSAERVGIAMSGREPDRVPFVISVTLHGARELGLSIREYYSRAENVVEGQWRMFRKYRHDAFLPAFYGAIDAEAWGSETIYVEDGPPNSGPPVIKSMEDIRTLKPPKVEESPRLMEALKAMRLMKERAGGRAPLFGVIISPFSLPVMQLGFERYLDVLYGRPDLFERLMAANEEFSVAWANAQLAAGASAIACADPVSSPTILPRETYLKTGLPVIRRLLRRIKGGVAIHLASGVGIPIIDDIASCGAVALSASAHEDLAVVKAACRGRMTVMGNLNAIEMRRWTPADAVAAVKTAIAKGGPGGGFVLSDNHGEIPWQVSEDTLLTISEAAHTWGRYPLTWTREAAT